MGKQNRKVSHLCQSKFHWIVRMPHSQPIQIRKKAVADPNDDLAYNTSVVATMRTTNEEPIYDRFYPLPRRMSLVFSLRKQRRHFPWTLLEELVDMVLPKSKNAFNCNLHTQALRDFRPPNCGTARTE